eukprot:TRINITY_DN3334_c0_g1_i6.p1 TRINITY_DN3334_c0_g1~~TRINITY_DN3334_c0_g1_i6.p1  ORF type:complete len:483 (+),score=116.02 TRINITY_DN3334_c0_g1_i6:190-1638(+)
MAEAGSINNSPKGGANSGEYFEDKISEDLEEKLRILDEFIKGKSEEQILAVRMHQLALIKILVFTHGKNQYYLVKGHTALGEAYLDYKCHEQAIDHLTIALKKNGKLFAENPESKEYHAHILTLLGKCYLETENYEDALELLDKALDIARSIHREEDKSCAEIMMLMASCHAKSGDYDIALDYLTRVWGIHEAKEGLRSDACAHVYLEIAKIYSKKEDYQNAVDYQGRAINNFIENNNESPEYIANLFSTLSTMQEKLGDFDGYLKSLIKVRDLYIQVYGINDKRTIKIKRVISLALLKLNKNEEALRELLETEDLESQLYGDNSVQIAKTQKIIGTLYLVANHYLEAQRYLSKALKVFEEIGNKKIVSEIKKKLKILKEMREKVQNQEAQEVSSSEHSPGSINKDSSTLCLSLSLFLSFHKVFFCCCKFLFSAKFFVCYSQQQQMIDLLKFAQICFLTYTFIISQSSQHTRSQSFSCYQSL